MALNSSMHLTDSAESNPFSLADRRVLVTGGTQGVGAAIAVAICRAGGSVVLTGLHHDAAATRTLRLCREYSNAELITVDLARPPEDYLDAFLRELDGAMPNINALCNNAGTYIDRPFLDMDPQTYRRTFDLNVTSGYFLTQSLARRWVADQVKGRVVFTGSINGFLAEPDHTAYDASKGAVIAMVRSLAVALAPHGIRVNSMAPGLVQTPLTSAVAEDPDLLQWMRHHTPNGEVPGPEVCGDTVVFLLSDAARHIHGQTILVDGGMSVWQQPDPM